MTIPGDEMFAYSPNRELESAAKVRALEALLIQKGVLSTSAVDTVLQHFERTMGPFNGAKLVAKAWCDQEFKDLLLSDCNAACQQLDMPSGMSGAEGEIMRVAENSSTVHNLIICTLCSCYPWPTLGLPPYWYKDPTFRARAAREPRAVLAEFGLTIEPTVEIRVWDSSGQIRWWVLPERPEGSEGMNEMELAQLVTAESMMGVAKVAI
jgi:nitrile hydratase subunit alpha